MRIKRAPSSRSQSADGSMLDALNVALTRFSEGDDPALIVTSVLDTICTLGQGRVAGLLVDPGLALAVADLPKGAQSVELSERAWLVLEGELARTIQDWEGNPDPMLLFGGTHLVVPMARGGLVIIDPAPWVATDAERIQGIRILMALALGVLRQAARLVDLEDRAAELQETRRRLREQTIQLGELAVIDPLTQLHNRRFFDDRLASEVERYRRYGHAVSVAILDIDFFKKVNDTYGHPAGDAVLKSVAQECLGAIRRVDLLARIGGEEFAVLMPETDAAGARVTMERLRANVEGLEVRAAGQTLRVTISGGVCSLAPGWEGEPRLLLDEADQALYAAKRGGRNRYEWRVLPVGVRAAS